MKLFSIRFLHPSPHVSSKKIEMSTFLRMGIPIRSIMPEKGRYMQLCWMNTVRCIREQAIPKSYSASSSALTSSPRRRRRGRNNSPPARCGQNRSKGRDILSRRLWFFSPFMQSRKRNHALRRAEPCKLRSPTMQVAERNHALSRVHGSARAFPSIETFFSFLT